MKQDDIIVSVVIIILILLILLIFFIGFRVGSEYTLETERNQWIEWTIENDYGGYNDKTGEFELHGKDWHKEKFKEEFPDLFELFKKPIKTEDMDEIPREAI